MIRRTHQKGDAASEAVYSGCEAYRYALTRVWDDGRPRVAFIMLNPSKATEMQNDPTIERCERRARALGFGGFRAVNIFAFRETEPALLRKALEPVGAGNDEMLLDTCGWADQIICGWGVHGEHLIRGPEVELLLRQAGHELHALGLTKAGHPRHPLYIGYKTQPERWEKNNG